MQENVNCYTRQYMLPVKSLLEAIEDQIDTWLANGVVIETSPSRQYNSPLLVVPKRMKIINSRN